MELAKPNNLQNGNGLVENEEDAFIQPKPVVEESIPEKTFDRYVRISCFFRLNKLCIAVSRVLVALYTALLFFMRRICSYC
jgi:hypothetical protein